MDKMEFVGDGDVKSPVRAGGRLAGPVSQHSLVFAARRWLNPVQVPMSEPLKLVSRDFTV